MQFDFGKNWDDYSRKALTPDRVGQARADFCSLMGCVDLRDKSFLDIGFGQGLSLLIAAECGARAVGCDINHRCAEVLAANRRFFPSLDPSSTIPVEIGSILDDAVVDRLRTLSARSDGAYDAVHSWGVLHHTGALWKALGNAVSLTAGGGFLVVAIYNAHWSSPLWKVVKRAYGASPRIIRQAAVLSLYPIIALAKAAVTRQNPFRQNRGMDFYYDVVDWVGGYPYEYASVREVTAFLEGKGFTNVKTLDSLVPTGCNQFVFVRGQTKSCATTGTGTHREGTRGVSL
jgi:SAM-dependent methyltransferase